MLPRMTVLSISAAFLLGLCFLSGCATPVGVDKISPREAYINTYTNPLNSAVLSDSSKFVLNRYNLLKQFKKDPAATIADLHEKALHDDRGDILYALAEATYLYGSQLGDSSQKNDQSLAPDYYLLSALYSFYFIKEQHVSQRLNIFDHRARTAVDMYNFGLWQAFATGDAEGLVLKTAERKLPFGSISITLDTTQLTWEIETVEKFLPADQYSVRGVSVRNRISGIGLPLITILKNNGKRASSMPVAASAILRVQGDLTDFNDGTARAVLELYSTQDAASTTTKNGFEIPIESDLTTPLAYGLEGSDLFDLGLMTFLGRKSSRIPDGLYMMEPYRTGKIPVVFVHGTASNPVWWAEMINTLRFDPRVRENYQFWYVVYTSNKAVVNSAGELRDALRDKVCTLDPQSEDPALQQMVVVGHSQGGLLTKFTVVDTGDKLIRALTGKDLDALQMHEEGKAKVRNLLVFKPLPFVKEVIFLSTPHRGSFRSKTWNRNLIRWLVTMPATMIQNSLYYYEYLTDDVKKLLGGKKSFFTSADGMSPKNPLLIALAEIPLATGVRGHSIIAVKTDGDPKLGNDGVVEYSSAHLADVVSELVVDSGHSSQLNPLAIDEVRRVLLENLEAFEKD